MNLKIFFAKGCFIQQSISDFTVFKTQLSLYWLMCSLQHQSLYTKFCYASANVQAKAKEKVQVKSVISCGKCIFLSYRMQDKTGALICILINSIMMLENKWQN